MISNYFVFRHGFVEILFPSLPWSFLYRLFFNPYEYGWLYENEMAIYLASSSHRIKRKTVFDQDAKDFNMFSIFPMNFSRLLFRSI